MKKFDELYNKIINEETEQIDQNNKNITVKLETFWHDSQEVEDFTKKMNQKNITAVFEGSSNDDSTWTLTGTKEALVDVIRKHWLQTGMDPDEIMSKKDMKQLGFF